MLPIRDINAFTDEFAEVALDASTTATSAVAKSVASVPVAERR